MFFFNRGYYWTIDKDNPPFGVITSPSSMPYGQIKRKFSTNKSFKPINEVLFDPQLYLQQDDYNSMHELESKIRSYHWMDSNFVDYDSKVINVNEYRKILKNFNFDSQNTSEPTIEEKISKCLKFQIDCGVTSLISPTPLILNKNSDFNYYLKWISNSINIYKKSGYTNDIYISVPLSEQILSNNPLDKNSYLQSIVDNLTSLDECISGFYINLISNKNEFYITDRNTINNIFELCFLLGKQFNKKVIINSIDILGFVCLSLGAYGFATGYTTKEKRINFEDLKDKDINGIPYPKFYSHSLITDFRPYKDLKKLVEINQLSLIKNDVTKYSESLIQSLTSPLNQIIEVNAWEERRNNVTASQKHKIELLVNETNKLNKLNDKEKIKYTLNWLSNSEKNISIIKSEFPSIDINHEHVQIWKECYQNFMFNLL